MSNAEAWFTSTSAKQRAMVKDYEAEMKWLSSSEAKQRGAAAKAHALSEFKKRFPRANISKFQVQVDFDPNRKATGRVLFPDGDGSWEDPLIEDGKYWSQGLRDALGFHQDGGFPPQLAPLIQTKIQQPIPAVDFSEEIQQSIGDVLNKELKIYVTPTEFFTTKFREIFKNTQIKFTSAIFARMWLAGPNLSFWPQQLNFALWCSTTQQLFPPGSILNLTPQVRSFYLFHVYFTIRRILYEIGGIESVGALPDDPTFNQKTNKYEIASYKKVCGEFGIDPSSDLRFTHGKNHGLGNLYIGVTYERPRSTDYNYPDPDLALFDDECITDRRDPNYKANGISFVRNDQGADKQFEYFVLNYSQGLTRAGLARINQSIEAYCYCILSVQARTRSTIHGVSGCAIEMQREFHERIEDSITLKNISASVQRYQEAIADTRMRLDFSVAKGVWLMPSRMVINTESIVGYDNFLVITDDTMKLGVNNNINRESHKPSLKHMAGGPSKVNPPNSHSSNPIHKKATEAQGLAVKKKPIQTPAAGAPATQTKATETPATQTQTQTPATDTTTTKEDPVDTHHVNKALVGFGALVFVGFVFWASK